MSNPKLELQLMDKIIFQSQIKLLIRLLLMENNTFQFTLLQIMLLFKKQFKLQRILKLIQSKLERKLSFPYQSFQNNTELSLKIELFQI